MVTITRKIRNRRLMPALSTQLTSRLARRARTSEPADGWFTLQTEPGDVAHTESVTIAAPRGETVDQSLEQASGSSSVGLRSKEGHAPEHRTFHAITSGHRRLLAAIAVIGALAGTAIAAVSSTGSDDRALIVVQRAQIARLAAERGQALATARQAQSGQVAWRAQAMRWRSRALAKRRMPRRRPRSRRGRRAR